MAQIVDGYKSGLLPRLSSQPAHIKAGVIKMITVDLSPFPCKDYREALFYFLLGEIIVDFF